MRQILVAKMVFRTEPVVPQFAAFSHYTANLPIAPHVMVKSHRTRREDTLFPRSRLTGNSDYILHPCVPEPVQAIERVDFRDDTNRAHSFSAVSAKERECRLFRQIAERFQVQVQDVRRRATAP